MIKIFTAIFGDYDILKYQPPQSIPCEFYCYTDNKNLVCEEGAKDQRKIIESKTMAHLNSRMQGKYFRMNVFDHLPANQGDIVLYLDGSAQIKSYESVKKLVEQFTDCDILAFAHPDRSSIIAEARECIIQGKDKIKGIQMIPQVNSYIAMGYPDQELHATSLLMYRYGNKKVRTMFKNRRAEVLCRTQHDQLAFDYCGWYNQVKVKSLIQNLRENELVQYIYPHYKEEKCPN